MALDGVFGDWKTLHGAGLAVDHPSSLMRISKRPPSFFPGDTVAAAGIYFYPAIGSMTVGDTFSTEVLITPANAFNKGYVFEIEGDTSSVSYDPLTGKLVALAEGSIQMTAISKEDELVSFSRQIQVYDIPVSSIRISPSEAEIMVDDTLFYTVEVLPENATVKDFTYEIDDPAAAVELDTVSGMVIARNAGTVQIIVKWVKGEVSDTLSIEVSDLSFTGSLFRTPTISLYPNPNDGLLHIQCDQQIEFNMKILDLGGKVVLQKKYSGSTQVETDQLLPGTYMVVHEGRDLIIRRKLVML